jgi:choline dehydrogenase-like flavoprotein
MNVWTDELLSKHINGENLQDRTTFDCDVLVIGSGAGGANTASILSSHGLKVIIIDEGPLKNQNDFKQGEKTAYSHLYQEGGARTTQDKSIKILQGRSVGGGTTINWTASFRTPPETLRHWHKEYDLPFTEESMRPWFEIVEKRYGISKWKTTPNKNNQSIAKAAQKLGWSHAVLNRNVKGCANLGSCGQGCPINAKQSTLITTIPNALKNGALLISRLRAQKLNLNGDKVTHVECSVVDKGFSKATNTKVIIKANHVVLAAGAIGSPAVLLRSAKYDNIFNPYDLVGSRTFLHPVCAVGGIMPYEINGEYGAPQSLYSDEFLNSRNGKVGFKLEVAPIQPAFFSTVVEGHGNKHLEIMQQRPKVSNMIALLRDGHHPESQGGKVMLNSYDLPKLDYPISHYLWEGFQTATEKMTEAFFAIGAKKVLPIHKDAKELTDPNSYQQALLELKMQKHYLKLFSAHVMGGCSIGKDEKKSVVNLEGKHHNLQNVWVMDGSIFPTSIGANPMESIFGFSEMLATKMAQKITGKKQ